MKKEYQKPEVKIVKFEYSAKADNSTEGSVDVGGWW